MIISLIVAMSKNRVIGRKNAIPWDLPADRAKFRAVTLGHPVIMGRRTFESIGNPLPGRTTIVVTRQVEFSVSGCVIVHSLQDALSMVQDETEVFICGGEELYCQSLALVQRMYITQVDQEIEGDTRFPEFSAAEFKEIIHERLPGSPSAVFSIFERVPD